MTYPSKVDTMHLPTGWSQLELTLRPPDGGIYVVYAYPNGSVLSLFFPDDHADAARADDHESIADAIAFCESGEPRPRSRLATCGPVNVDADGRSVE